MATNSLPNYKLTAKPKRAYRRPQLIKHGRVTDLTLKGGSAYDMMTGANTQQA